MTAEVRDQGNLRFVNPSELAPPPGYTHVVEASGGRTVYLSGQVALDASGEVMGIGDLRAQTRQVFENLEVALGAVGAGFKDVVKLTYYVADPSWEGGALRSVRDEYVDIERRLSQQHRGGGEAALPGGATRGGRGRGGAAGLGAHVGAIE